MNKKTIIYIAYIIAVVLIIAFSIFFIIRSRISNSNESVPLANQKFIITKYDDDFETKKTVEVSDKSNVKKLKKIFQTLSLEQDEESKYYAIRNDLKIEQESGIYIMIQTDFTDYCYYEDPSSETKLIIKTPDGLLELANNILSGN